MRIADLLMSGMGRDSSRFLGAMARMLHFLKVYVLLSKITTGNACLFVLLLKDIVFPLLFSTFHLKVLRNESRGSHLTVQEYFKAINFTK